MRTVLIFLLLIICATYVLGSDWFQIRYNPEKYWETKITSLNRYLEADVIFLRDCDSERMMREAKQDTKEMAFELMSTGLAREDAVEQATEFNTKLTNTMVSLCESYLQAYKASLAELENAERRLQMVKEN